MLLVAIRGILPKIVNILCQLKMFFPPSFFDVMIYLLVHLVRGIKFYGLVYVTWMYPIERYLEIMKACMKNQYRLEASMIKWYIAKESIKFCSDCMTKANLIGVPPKSWLKRCFISKCIWGVNVVTKDHEELLQENLYVLNNTDKVIPYLSAHKANVK